MKALLFNDLYIKDLFGSINFLRTAHKLPPKQISFQTRLYAKYIKAYQIPGYDKPLWMGILTTYVLIHRANFPKEERKGKDNLFIIHHREDLKGCEVLPEGEVRDKYKAWFALTALRGYFTPDEHNKS